MASRVPIHGKSGVVAHATVDDDDLKLVSSYRWYLNQKGYAVRPSVGRRGAYRHLKMHRLIVGLEHGDPRHTHHINRDPLDNRRENLVVLTSAEHSRIHLRRPLSGPPYIAKVQVNGKRYFLGHYATELEARIVVDRFLDENTTGPAATPPSVKRPGQTGAS